MPATAKSFPFRAGEVILGDDGEIVSVTERPGGRNYLIGGGSIWAVIADRRVLASMADPTADIDEMEVRGNLGGSVTVTVRHSFAAGWGVRLVLANETSDAVALEARMTWVPGPDCPAWALPAGATGGYAVLAPDGTGPLLGGELTRGSLVEVAPEWLGLGRIELPPLGRYVVQWQWDWYSSPQRYERGRFLGVPRQLVLRTGETARFSAGDDEAVVARGVDLARAGGELEMSTDGPCRVPVQISSALGVTSFDITWVVPAEEVLVELGACLVPGRLAGIDAALAVQYLLASGRADDPEAAGDALDRFTGRLLDAAPALGPREVGYLCAEFERTGEAEVLAAATAGLMGMGTPAPGVGLAATHLCVARMVAGQSVEEVLDHLASLEVLVSGAGLGDLAIRLELLVVGRRTSADLSVRSEFDMLLDRVGPWLGAGLRGRPVRPLAVDDLAHLGVVLGLLPEEVGAPARREWGMSPHALARKTEAEVIDRLKNEPPRPAYGWLALGSRLR